MILVALIHGIDGKTNPQQSTKPMSMLPFLQPKSWPKMRKFVGESRYGFNEDDELIESTLDELMGALESKDHKKMMSCIHALMDLIDSREDQPEESDATNTQQEA